MNSSNVYLNPAFYVFLTTLTAFILLLLTVLSVPLVSNFYFLYSSQANGVRFGMWGWCLNSEFVCSEPLKLGYTWEPIISPITSALVFYPMAVVMTFLTLVSLFPVLCARSQRGDKVFIFLAWTSFGLSAFGFLFMMGMFSVAKSKFVKRGFEARFGTLPWMSLAATLLLLVVAASPFFFTPPPKEPPVRTNTQTRRRHHRRNPTDIEARPSKRREISRRPTEKSTST